MFFGKKNARFPKVPLSSQEATIKCHETYTQLYLRRVKIKELIELIRVEQVRNTLQRDVNNVKSLRYRSRADECKE